MNKRIIFLFNLTILSLLCLFLLNSRFFNQKEKVYDNNVNYTNDIKESPEIIVDSPKPNDIVKSPLVVRGKARGSWYFEGEFPLTLYYGVGNNFVNINAFALGEWMTEDYVDFEVIINFPKPLEKEGTLELRKNNPSDIKEQDKSLIIPLRFQE